MSMGLKRMQGLGWVALVFLVAISLYPLSLNVGTMHSKLVLADRDIVETRKEISYLQAEIRARASIDQLEKWNDLLYGYDAPRPAQYLGSTRALADLHGDDLGPQTPVMVSAAYGLNTAPIGTIGDGGHMASATDTAPVASGAPSGAKAHAVPSTTQSIAMASAAAPKALPIKQAATPRAGAANTPAAVHEKRVAQLESSLLGPAALRDIQLRAAVEKARQ